MSGPSIPTSGRATPSADLSEGLTLTFRDRALLGAVVDGSCHIERGSLPYFTIDRRGACDQLAAYQLLARGLIEAGPTGLDGRSRARLTDAGLAAIESPRCRTSEGRIAERGTSGRASGTSGIDSRR